MFRSFRSRLIWRVKLIRASLTLPRVAGADDDPPPPATPPATPPVDPPKTFTQDDLDRVVRDRLKRDRQDRPSDEEIADLKGKAAKFEEIEAASRTELETAQAERDAAKQTAEEAVARANQTLRKAAVIAASAEAGADPEIVHALLAERGFKITQEDNTFEVTVGDDGQVTGASEAVKALIELKNIVGTSTPPGPGDGGVRTPVPAKSFDDELAEAERTGDTAKAMSLKSQKLAAQMVQ